MADLSILPADLAKKLSSEDQTKLNNALADAVGVVTTQSRQDLANFVAKYGPAITVYSAEAAAGNAVAVQNIKHLQVQMIQTASQYGVNLLQKQEQALLVALQVFSKLAAGMIVASAAG